MRPALLNPLFAPVTSLPGVGPKQDKLLRYLLSRSETPRLVAEFKPDVVIASSTYPMDIWVARRIARRALVGPAPERPEAGLLIGFLGGVQIPEVAQQGADRLGPRRGERGVYPGKVGHPAAAWSASAGRTPGAYSSSGRIS